MGGRLVHYNGITVFSVSLSLGVRVDRLFMQLNSQRNSATPSMDTIFHSNWT